MLFLLLIELLIIFSIHGLGEFSTFPSCSSHPYELFPVTCLLLPCSQSASDLHSGLCSSSSSGSFHCKRCLAVKASDQSPLVEGESWTLVLTGSSITLLMYLLAYQVTVWQQPSWPPLLAGKHQSKAFCP